MRELHDAVAEAVRARPSRAKRRTRTRTRTRMRMGTSRDRSPGCRCTRTISRTRTPRRAALEITGERARIGAERRGDAGESAEQAHDVDAWVGGHGAKVVAAIMRAGDDPEKVRAPRRSKSRRRRRGSRPRSGPRGFPRGAATARRPRRRRSTTPAEEKVFDKTPGKKNVAAAAGEKTPGKGPERQDQDARGEGEGFPRRVASRPNRPRRPSSRRGSPARAARRERGQGQAGREEAERGDRGTVRSRATMVFHTTSSKREPSKRARRWTRDVSFASSLFIVCASFVTTHERVRRPDDAQTCGASYPRRRGRQTPRACAYRPASRAPHRWTRTARGSFASRRALASPGRRASRLRLFCLPQAGAGAWCFHNGARAAPGRRGAPRRAPGRNSRASEPADAHPTLQRLASAVLDGVRHLLPGGSSRPTTSRTRPTTPSSDTASARGSPTRSPARSSAADANAATSSPCPPSSTSAATARRASPARTATQTAKTRPSPTSPNRDSGPLSSEGTAPTRRFARRRCARGSSRSSARISASRRRTARRTSSSLVSSSGRRRGRLRRQSNHRRGFSRVGSTPGAVA